MVKKHVVIELVPGFIGVSIHEGSKVVESRTLEVATDDDAGEWAKTLRRSAVSVGALVEELQIAGCETRVLYRSPTQLVDLSGYAVRSTAQAIDAAKMSCADSVPYSMLTATCEAMVVGRDAGGDPPETHVVVAADREDISEAIVYLIEEAGLRFCSAAPIDALLMASLVRRELASKEHRGTLYVGQYTSFFVVSSRGTLLFSRRIDLGFETLVSSLTRPINIRGRAEIELTDEEARALLARHGIPGRDDEVHEAHGLTGTQVVPLLQPVLQRFIVELRQSLRFGLSDTERTDLTLFVTGAGSALKNFASLIGQELGIEAASDTTYPDPDPALERTDALRDNAFLDGLNLMPRPLATDRRTKRLRRWMITGAAAAMVLIAVEGARYHMRVKGAQLEADVYASQIADVQALQSTSAQLKSVMGAKYALQGSINQQIGLVVNYRACLQELSRVTPRTIRFTKIDFNCSQTSTTGLVTGFAFESEDHPGKTDLETFIEGLQASPLFTEAVLGNVQIGHAGDSEGQQFQATFTAVPTPRGRGLARQVAAVEDSGETP